MEFFIHAALFLLFVALFVVIPGAAIVSAAGPRLDGIPSEELGVLSVLSGLSIFLIVWMLSRWLGIGYQVLAFAYPVLIMAVAAVQLSRCGGRAACSAALAGIFSRESLFFLLLSLPLAAWLTYADPAFYYEDEQLRLAIARSVIDGLPLQNPMLYTGEMRYHFAAEFFAGSASAVMGIPLETVYFRFLLPFNWWLLFISLRAVSAGVGTFKAAPFMGFALFLLAHTKMVAHFTFRQNTFSLALAALTVALLYTCFRRRLLVALPLICVSPALAFIAKVPMGALLLALVCASMLAGWREGRISAGSALGCAAISSALCGAVYGGLFWDPSGQSGQLFSVGTRPGWLREFFPEWMPRLSAVGAALPYGKFFSGLSEMVENFGTMGVSGAVPLSAAAYLFLRPRYEPSEISLLKAGLAVFIISLLLFSFLHFTVANGSDSYWAFFGSWLLGICVFPFYAARLCSDFGPVKLAAAALPAVGGISAAGLSFLFPFSPPAWVAWPMLCSVSAIMFLRHLTGRKVPILFWAVWWSGLVLFSSFSKGAWWWFAASWAAGLACGGMLSSRLGPGRMRAALAAMLLAVPFSAAVSAPRYLSWASAWKTWTRESWSAENKEACAVVRVSGQKGLLLHNRLEGTVFAMAAGCARRMFVSAANEGIWEERGLYASAREEAVSFFSGKIAGCCGWLDKRGVSHVYVESAGTSFQGTDRCECLVKVYSGPEVSVYEKVLPKGRGCASVGNR
jgi:hypothetical protein